MHRKKHGSLERAERKYQAWPEIVAWHLDRLMGFNLKPPITSRIITNKELFIYGEEFETAV